MKNRKKDGGIKRLFIILCGKNLGKINPPEKCDVGPI
jgi:hypothetical protein